MKWPVHPSTPKTSFNPASTPINHRPFLSSSSPWPPSALLRAASLAPTATSSHRNSAWRNSSSACSSALALRGSTCCKALRCCSKSASSSWRCARSDLVAGRGRERWGEVDLDVEASRSKHRARRVEMLLSREVIWEGRVERSVVCKVIVSWPAFSRYQLPTLFAKDLLVSGLR